MKTRFITLTAVLLLSTLALQGQVKVGILAGVNFQNINGQDESGVKFDNGLMTGFHGGINVAIAIAPDFYLVPGVLYSLKGTRSNDLIPLKASGDFATTMRLSYIEVPVNLMFRPQFMGGHILVGFGPYLGYALGGKAEYKIGATTLESDARFGETVSSADNALYPCYKHLDAGANIFAGYEFSFGLFLQLDTQLGLLKINSEIEGDTGEQLIKRNTGFGLSAGFRF